VLCLPLDESARTAELESEFSIAMLKHKDFRDLVAFRDFWRMWGVWELVRPDGCEGNGWGGEGYR